MCIRDRYLDASLPMEIVEAAPIDGAGEFYTFNKIVLPIMKPALAVQAIFSFVATWNNYLSLIHIWLLWQKIPAFSLYPGG